MAFVFLVLTIFVRNCNAKTTIKCSSDMDCTINCDNVDQVNGCADHIIDASDALSLDIICDSSKGEYVGGCQFSEIYCPTSVNSSFCHVECTDLYACYSTKIHSELSNDVDVICNNNIGSCLKTILYANYSTNAEVSCYGDSSLSSTDASCDGFQIYAEDINQISLLCDGQNACNMVELYVNYADYVDIFAGGLHALSGYIHAENSNYFHLFCGGKQTEYACYKTFIFTPPYESIGNPRSHIECQGNGCKDQLYFYSTNGALDVDISLNTCTECDGPSTCINNMYFYCDYLRFDTFHGDSCDSTLCGCDAAQLQFTKKFNECSLFDFDFECESGDECIIDCTNGNTFVDGCSDKRINANNATSLHLICPSAQCQSSDIYCPSIDNSPCIVDCLNKDSCVNITVNVVNANNSSLNLTCFETDSCIEGNIYSEYNSDITVNCLAYDSCYDMNITANHADNITILCDADSQSSYSACNKFTVFGTYVANSLKLICDGDHSCYYLDIYANYSNNVIIDANGDYATYHGNVFASNSSNMLISCKSRYNDRGCYDTNFYISTFHTSIECEGYGCYDLSLYSVNGYSAIKALSINGCGQCDSIDYCISRWDMHCDNAYSISTTFYGYPYYKSECNHDDSFVNMVNNAWSDNENLANLRQCDILDADKFCNNGENCVIKCTEQNSCERQIILGYNTTSLTVICSADNSCQYAKIYCPKSEHSECNIACGYRACSHAVIYGGANHTAVNLMCTNMYSCQYTGVFVENSLSVNISCVGSSSCYRMDIEGDNATDIAVHCSSNGACYSVELHGINTNTLSLSCIGDSACESGYIYGNNARNLLIYSIGVDSLNSAKIYAQSASNAILEFESYRGDNEGCGTARIYVPANDQMSIKCVGYGCDSLNFYSKNGMNDIKNISLFGDSQCFLPESCISNWNLYCSESYSSYYDTSTKFTRTICADDECDCNDLSLLIQQTFVPGTEPLNADITCGQTDCEITCSYDCKNAIIDGRDALSLSVDCSSSNICEKTQIHCPTSTNSSCQVICNGYNSCYQTVIIGSNNANLEINAYENSFKYGTVVAKEIHKLNITCFSDNSCYETDVFSSEADIVNIACHDQRACYGLNMYANNAKDVFVFGGTGEYTLYNAIIYANNAGNFRLTCVAGLESMTNGGCYGTNIYFPPNERTTLNCYGFGCKQLALYITNGMDSLMMSNINFNGCEECNSPEQCIIQWSIHCSPYQSYTYTRFLGSECPSYYDCNCIPDLITNIFTNIRVPQCFTNTYLVPTMQPTISPTVIPTSTPTSTHTTTTKVSNEESNKNNESELNVGILACIVLLVVLFIVIVALVGVVVYCYYKNVRDHLSKDDDKFNNVTRVQLNNVETDEVSGLKTDDIPIDEENNAMLNTEPTQTFIE